MGRRNRERKERIRAGQETPIAERVRTWHARGRQTPQVHAKFPQTGSPWGEKEYLCPNCGQYHRCEGLDPGRVRSVICPGCLPKFVDPEMPDLCVACQRCLPGVVASFSGWEGVGISANISNPGSITLVCEGTGVSWTVAGIDSPLELAALIMQRKAGGMKHD